MSYYGPPQGAPSGPPPHFPPPKKKSRAGLIVVGVIAGALVMFAGCGALIASVGDTPPERSPLPQAGTSEAASQPRTDPPAEQTEDDTPTATPTPTPEMKPQTFNGVGAKVVKVKETEQALIASLSHRGSANFIVHPIDPEGAEQSILVNEIGNYKGTVLVNEEAGKVLRGFKIEADGAWTLTLKPLSSAEVWSGDSTSGRGDQVLVVMPAISGLTTADVRHSGSGNFIVNSYGEDSSELLVNEIGSYKGEILLPDGTILLSINADGRWSFTKS